MQALNKLVSEKPSHLILGVIFILYILLNVQTPPFLATPIDTIYGKVIISVIAIIVFMHTNPVIGVLGLVVAYQLIKTASVTTGTYAIKHYLPSEKSKSAEMQNFNVDFNASLEEEMVDKMVPMVIYPSDPELTYKPILDGQHDAAMI